MGGGNFDIALFAALLDKLGIQSRFVVHSKRTMDDYLWIRPLVTSDNATMPKGRYSEEPICASDARASDIVVMNRGNLHWSLTKYFHT